MQVGFGSTHVGALLDQFGRQAERQVGGQLEVGELEVLGDRVARQSPDQVGHQVALLRQGLLQRRQSRLGLRQGGLLRGDVGAGNGAEAGLLRQDAERFTLRCDDALGRFDLGA